MAMSKGVEDEREDGILERRNIWVLGDARDLLTTSCGLRLSLIAFYVPPANPRGQTPVVFSSSRS